MKTGNRILVALLAAISLFMLYGSMAGGSTFGPAFLLAALAFFGGLTYFLPTIIAISRDHANTTGVVVINLLLGWTLIGWVASLVWSLVHDRSAELLAVQERARSEAPRRTWEQGAAARDVAGTPAGAPAATKTCPFCAEQVLIAAIKCKHCGSDLPSAGG